MKHTKKTEANHISAKYSDIFVVNSARVSFSKESSYDKDGNLSPEDTKLINYLAKHDHWTPFSHIRATFLFSDIDMDWALTILTPNNFCGMVINKVMHNNKCYWAIRHSFYGWIKLLALNITEHLFQPSQAAFVYKKLKELYPVSTSTYSTIYDFSKYENNNDSSDTHYVDNILEKNNNDYVYKLFNNELVEHFVDITIREIVPIFVARQRFKHMVGFCVAKDTKIYIESGNKGRNGTRKIPIEKLYNRLNKNAKHSRTNNVDYHREGLMNLNFRVYDTENKKFTTSKLLDVIYSGKKPLYKITIENGYEVTVTEDHELLTENGWDTLKNIVGLSLSKNNIATMSKIGYVACNGVKYAGTGEYQNKEWLETMKNKNMTVSQIAHEAQCSIHTIKKWLHIHNLGRCAVPPPWNKGKFGYKPNTIITEEHKQKIRDARSGEKSNFWKGGVSTERQTIGRWTREQSKNIFKRDNYTCTNCKKTGNKLHAHHVIPVYADLSKAKDFDNLTTLCQPCHNHIHNNNLEIEFATNLNVPVEHWKEKPKGIGNTLTAKYNKILKVEYVGVDDVYDLSIEHDSHNFVGNGVVLHNCFNESSRRYVDFEPKYFMPDVLRGRAKNKKQGSIDGPCFNEESAKSIFKKVLETANSAYLELLGDLYFVCPEQARAILPQSMMTDYYATGSYSAWKRLEYLRLDPHSQVEIQEHAKEISEITKLYMNDINDYKENCTISIEFE